MMKNLRFLFLLPALLAAGSVSAQSVAFENVRLFDGSELTAETTVLVEDGKISAIGPATEIPDGVDTISGDGLTLLPGLIDSHVHVFYPEALQQELVFGVTAVLDMFTAVELAEYFRAEQEAGPVTDRADFHSAGILATPPGGHGTQFGVDVPNITEPGMAEDWVEDRVAEGSEYIKVILESGEELGQDLPTLDEETTAAIVKAAHDRDLLVVAHVQTLAMARIAASAGVDGLAHVFTDAVADDDFVQQLADSGMFVIPTLTVFREIGTEGNIPERISMDEHLAPFLPREDLQNLAAPYTGFEDLSIETGLENVRLLHEAGVPILAGTDAMNPGTVYGASMHEEMQLLVEAGLEPEAALAAATSVPARVFGLEDQGTIEEGAAANLLLVNGDPTDDILASRDIAGVWKHGEAVDREAWSEALASQAEEEAAQAEELAGLESAIIGDFEEGDTSVPFGQPWLATTDAEAGGNSTAEIKVVEGGPGDSDWMLEVTGEVGTDFMQPWSGVMFMPGSTPFGPANLENMPQLHFQAAGTPGEYRVQLFCENNMQLPGEWTFEVTEDWQEYDVNLSDIGDCATTGVLNIIFSSGTPGEYVLRLDNISLQGADAG